MNDTARRLQAIVAQVAPLDFTAERPLLVACSGDLPREYQTGNCSGYATQQLGEILAPHLRDWTEGAQAVVVDDRISDWRVLIGATLHEAAHVIDMRTEPATEKTPLPLESAKWQLSAGLANIRAGKMVDPTPWYGHEKTWIRIMCHLITRAREHHNITCCDNVGGGTYKLSGGWEYAKALGSEVEDNRHRALCDIIAEPPPPEFSQLFARDVASWFQRQLAKAS